MESEYNHSLKWYHPEKDFKTIKATDINIIEAKKDQIQEISIDMCPQPKLAPGEMLKTYTQTPNVLINCGFFATSTGESTFNIISDNIVYSTSNQYTGGFGITQERELKGGEVYERQWKDFVSSYPTLIKDGQVLPYDWLWGKEIDYKAHRNIFGWTQDKVFDIGIEGSGATFKEMQELIITLYPEVEQAFNLDGGGSLTQYFDGERISDSGWERPIDNVLIIFMKPGEKKILYRAQLGAFSKKQNADNYLNKIQSLKTELHDYSDAYVKYIEPYYKVQCGAFSKKENAENMLTDLKNHGYEGFIVTEER